MKKDAISISLRKRVIPSGKTTLYIEYYIKPIADVIEELKGRRTYEPLGLFLLPDENKINNKTLAMAEIALGERKALLNKHPFNENLLKGFCATDFMAWLCDGNCPISLPYGKVMFANTLSALRTFSTFNIAFEAFTQEFMDKFAEFLATTSKRSRFGEVNSADNKRKPSTIKSYLKTLQWTLKCAAGENLYKLQIPSISVPQSVEEPTETTNAVYLTNQELKAVSRVEDCNSKVYKAFIFACLTGVSMTELRVICKQNLSKHSLTFVSKTRGKITLPVSHAANTFLEDVSSYREDAPIFNLPGDLVLNREITNIFQKAGIDKKPTNSMPRHTFVMNLLDEGVPIQDISHLLGYKFISSMQVYADLHGYRTNKLVEDIINKTFI